MEFIYNYSIHISSFLLVIACDVVSKAMQGLANDRPEIAQRIFKNRGKSIGAAGFEPAPSAPKALDQQIATGPVRTK